MIWLFMLRRGIYLSETKINTRFEDYTKFGYHVNWLSHMSNGSLEPLQIYICMVFCNNWWKPQAEARWSTTGVTHIFVNESYLKNAE